MELRHLTSFSTVARTLSFTEAARRLGYVQSAVTGHVKALEQQLGVRLFDRIGRRVALTEAGQQLFDYAVRIDRLAQEAQTAVRGPSTPAGPVRVSAPETLCAHRLPAMLSKLYEAHPEVRVLFQASSTGALDNDLVRALSLGEVDLAFVLEERLDAVEPLAVEPVTEEPLVIVAAPQHPLAREDVVTARDLDGVPLLLSSKGCRFRGVLERACADEDVRPEVIGEFTSGEAIKRCAQAGSGLGVVAAVSAADELARGALVSLPWKGPELRVHSYLVWNTARWPTPALLATIETAREVLGSDAAG